MYKKYILPVIYIVISIIVIYFIYTFFSSNNSDNNLHIERICLKSFIDPSEFKHVSKNLCLLPSYFNGRMMETNLTTYYDFPSHDIYNNRHKPQFSLPAVVRIRSYKHSPDQYIEIKYRGGIKMRGLIDSNNDLISTEENNEEILVKYLNMIKKGKLIPVISNSYNRHSYILNRDPLIRVTIDTDLQYTTDNNYTFNFSQDILELKIPRTYNHFKINKLLKYLNNNCKMDLEITNFSKFDYGFEHVKKTN